MTRAAALAATLVFAACAPTGPMTGATPASDAMTGMAGDVRSVPPVTGFADGQEILFIHTEASDTQVAEMLTRMMGSPVLVVPALAQVPPTALADVYVFKNGVKGDGPFGFQPDVFDGTPSTPGYSPLRSLHLVTWRGGVTPRVLRSVGDVKEAERRAEIAIERSGAVVNMPMLRWPGGQR